MSQVDYSEADISSDYQQMMVSIADDIDTDAFGVEVEELITAVQNGSPSEIADAYASVSENGLNQKRKSRGAVLDLLHFAAPIYGYVEGEIDYQDKAASRIFKN